MPAAIRTERLTLRQPLDSDAEPIAALIGDWQVVRMLTNPPWPYTVSDARDYFARKAGAPWNFLVQTDRPIGMVGLTDLLGYWFGRAWWGCGYATKAAAAALDAWLAETDADGIVFGAFVENAASPKVLAKLGFRETGRGPRYSNARGVEVDHIDMWLSRADWAPRRRPAEAVAP